MIRLSNAVEELRRIIEEAEDFGAPSLEDIIDLHEDLLKAFLQGAELVKPSSRDPNRFRRSRSMTSSRNARKSPAMKKRRPSGKSKILNEMAKKKWATYKKGKGKKTYIQIRAEVSRSQAYKRKVKNL